MTTIEQYIESVLSRFPEWRPYADLIAVPPAAEEVIEEFPEMSRSSLCRSEQEHDFTSWGITRLALYTIKRREGQPHRLAEMLASQRGPRVMTDDVFFQGMPRLAEQFGDDRRLDFYVKQARKHGYNPNPNDVYHSGLARFPGDPQAWVSKAQGRGYIKKLCEERGWGCDGAVNVKARQPESDPLAPENCKPLSDKIVRRYATEMVQKDPSLKNKSRREIREMVIAKHGPST